MDGKHIVIVLDKAQHIRRPTLVYVDKDGKQLVVINKDGTEIRNYNINYVRFVKLMPRFYLM